MDLIRLKSIDLSFEGELINVKAGKLFYVFTGRNAWHSTWVTQYSDGCMHFTLDSAKSYAEERRVSGTVFNIRELPCLVLESEEKCVLVTQINEDEPLLSYSTTACADLRPSATPISGILSSYMSYNASFRGAVLSFMEGSRFWSDWIRQGSVMIFESVPDASITVLGKESLLGYSSRSEGSGYYLGWLVEKSEISGRAVRRIVRYFEAGDRLDGDGKEELNNIEALTDWKERLRLFYLDADNDAEKLSYAIDLFGDEISFVITECAVEMLPDSTVRILFNYWIKALDLSNEYDRRKWLSRMLSFNIIPYSPGA